MLNSISINYIDVIKDILKNKKYPNVGTIPKSNIKIVEIGNIDPGLEEALNKKWPS